MKKGKTFHLQGFENAKVVYGTVDSVNFKSIYLNIQSWVEPIYECENWKTPVMTLTRGVKHSVHKSINKKIFKSNFIVDLDLRSSGIHVGKKSFMNLEIQMYTNEDNIDFKSKEIKNSITEITDIIFNENFKENKSFKFYLTNKPKNIEITLQI